MDDCTTPHASKLAEAVVQEVVDPTKPLSVHITREAFTDWFVLKCDNGTSEQLDPDETREWFKQRGANMDAVERALDYCWNFFKASIVINNPRSPLINAPRIQPQII